MWGCAYIAISNDVYNTNDIQFNEFVYVCVCMYRQEVSENWKIKEDVRHIYIDIYTTLYNM